MGRICPSHFVGYWGYGSEAEEVLLGRIAKQHYQVRTCTKLVWNVAFIVDNQESIIQSDSNTIASLSAAGIDDCPDVWVRLESNTTLLLGRDVFGRVPLYWVQQGQVIWFASQLQLLLPLLDAPQVNLAAVYGYSCFSYVPTPLTPVVGVQAVAAGTQLAWNLRIGDYFTIRNAAIAPMARRVGKIYDEVTAVAELQILLKNALANRAGLKISGLHFYRGTGTNATTAFTAAIGTIFDIAKELPDWEYLDFGGGFGYPYRHGGAAFDWEMFGAQLTGCLEELGSKIDLVIEPGRSAIAQCGTLLARVVSVKWQDEKQIVGVDTTVANLSVPSVHGGYREIIAYSQSSRLFSTDVCGNTTYSRDYLGKNCQLPALDVGDIVAILDVGAYGYAMSSHFLHRPKPGEVLLENGGHRLIRKREDYSVLLGNQM